MKTERGNRTRVSFGLESTEMKGRFVGETGAEVLVYSNYLFLLFLISLCIIPILIFFNLNMPLLNFPSLTGPCTHAPSEWHLVRWWGFTIIDVFFILFIFGVQDIRWWLCKFKNNVFFLVEIQKQCYVILIAWVLKKNRPGPIQPSNQLLQTKTLKSNAGFDCFNHSYVTGDERLGLILRVFKL